jgi:hypothetical protein
MNLTQYNALTGDTKLAAALAIAMGWKPHKRCMWWHSNGNLIVWDEHFVSLGSKARIFDPFTDDSIPYGLIGFESIDRLVCSKYWNCYEAFAEVDYGGRVTHSSKTHVIVLAYIAADPMGHLAKFLSTKE